MDQAVEKFIAATDFTFIPSEKMKVHIFKVKPGDEAMMKLIETGFFDGNESFIRETTTKDRYGDWGEHNYTIIYKNGRSWSWESGTSGYTLVSEETNNQRRIIDRAISKLLN
jgi:hypothetical protein